MMNFLDKKDKTSHIAIDSSMATKNNFGGCAKVSEWSYIEVWTVVNEKHQTPDLSLIVQGIINQGSWVSGNAIAFILTGTGVRTAESYNGERVAAPTLHIKYVNP